MSRTTRSATKAAQNSASSIAANSHAKRKRSPSTNATSKKTPKVKKEERNASRPFEHPSSKSTSSKVKTESPSPKKEDLSAKKLKAYSQYAKQSPFPDFTHPTSAECKLAHRILAAQHGARTRPAEVVAPTSRAGCGDSPSVLDALVRTILSQNTSDANSTRAKRSMDKEYGGSDNWSAIVSGGAARLEGAIKCGGLAATKSKVILSILEQVHAKYGKYSLDHLHDMSDEAAMQEMIAFKGVGPKTASCVSLFCLRRESFAVDTHVWRITGLLGWRPKAASRDETYAHLDALIPDEDKYGLHILLVKHGKVCDECKAGGRNLGKCELRKAFAKGKLVGDAGKDVKEEAQGDLDQDTKTMLLHNLNDVDGSEEEKPKIKEET